MGAERLGAQPASERPEHRRDAGAGEGGWDRETEAYLNQLIADRTFERGSVPHITAKQADQAIQGQLGHLMREMSEGRKSDGKVAVVGDKDFNTAGEQEHTKNRWHNGICLSVDVSRELRPNSASHASALASSEHRLEAVLVEYEHQGAHFIVRDVLTDFEWSKDHEVVDCSCGGVMLPIRSVGGDALDAIQVAVAAFCGVF